jgi:transcriptional regulator with XRE-family HTH domain
MPQPSVPFPIERAIQRLGENINLTRRRRQWTQEMLAQRMMVSISTVRRLEEGRMGIAIEHLARALYALGELPALDQIFSGGQDSVGQILMDERLPKRVRLPKSKPSKASEAPNANGA